jgi:putative membrane protein
VTAEATSQAGPAPVRRVHPITPLLRSGLVVLAVGSWLLRNLLEGQNETRALLVIPVALVGALLLGLASWWFTRFRISADELRIDSGVLVRRQRRVRIERIQAVEVQQPLLARMTGMAELRIEVAGGDGAKLAYLSLREAEALRRTLLEEARSGVPAPEMPAWQPVLFRVDDGRLLAATLLRSDVMSLLLIMVVTGAVSIAMSQPGGLAGVFPSAVAAVGMAWRGFTRGYGTILSRAERGLRVRAGMLDVRTQSVPTGRVQGVVVVEPVLWRLLGWARVDVTVAGVGAGDDAERATGVLVPVARRAEVGALLPLVLDGADPADVHLEGVPRRARWVDPVGAGVLGIGFGDRLLVTRRGVVTRRTDVVPLPKPQSLHVAQGPLQRRLRLASVQVHLPSGPVSATAAHRDAGQAWALATTVTAWRAQRAPRGQAQVCSGEAGL